MKKYDLTVIIPTFNEAENIENIIRTVSEILRGETINGEILVVDDNSGDGTIEIVKGMKNEIPDVKLIVREEDHGLSQSVVEGFLNAQADIIQVLDADFSHPPELIPEFYNSLKEGGSDDNEDFDIVIGSRYIKGGDIENWPLKRRVISLGATFFGRVLFPDITDPVSGFFAIKKDVIAHAVLRPRGYKILMEVLGKGTWKHAKEIPFTFKDRKEGESKLKLSTMVDYMLQCIDIGFYALNNHDTSVWKEWKKVIKFGLVGASGIVVNTGILYALTEYLGLYYMVSSVFAIETSIITNFILNDIWTFDGSNKSNIPRRWKRFLSFQLVSICGVLINIAILFILTEFAGIYYLASNIVGILIAFIWNFFVNRHVTWKNKSY